MIIFFTILVLAVILVNGWTDAPNAISTCISTRSMSPRGALALAAVCNFTGSVGMAALSPKVAQTVFNIVGLPASPHKALSILSAGMFAVVLWALAAFRFGIPTSESHALLSGICGAAVAGEMRLSVINRSELCLVFLGLLLSTVPAAITARTVYSVMLRIFAKFKRQKVTRYFKRAQCFSAATSALLHGAQDSQKFMGVFMLGSSLLGGKAPDNRFTLPLPVILVCATVMTLGTLIGGGRIIKKVGMEMVDLDAVGGTAADISSSAVLFGCSMLGIPVSTTHSKACAMMGVGSHRRGGGADSAIIKEMLLAWVLTFPICAAIGFFLGIIIS